MINEKHPDLVSKACLQNFSYDEIESPFATLHSFFDYRSLTDHLAYLAEWKKLVKSNSFTEFSTVNNPLHDYKMFSNLINAAFLIYQRRQLGHEYCDLHDGKPDDLFLSANQLNHDVSLVHLDISMLINPYLGLEKVFEYFTPQQYLEQLYEWLNASLCPNVRIDDQPLVETVYHNLQILVESAWLICSQEQFFESFEPTKTHAETESHRPTVEKEMIPPHIITAFKSFLGLVPAKRLNRNLRKMLMDYLFYNSEGLPTDFNELLTDFYWLTDLLDEIEGKEIESKFL